MRKAGFFWCAIIGLAVVCPQGARAQNVRPNADLDPEAVAARCVHHVNAIAEHCIQSNTRLSHHCVALIHRLLEAGHVERAKAVAHKCIHAIDRQTAACLATIDRICQHCVRLLLHLGADELAQRVRNACQDAGDRVKASHDEAIKAIRDAFDSDVSIGAVK